jgi:hypothetical protein
MLDWLAKKFAKAYVVRRLERDPAVILGRRAILDVWTNKHDVVKDFDTKTIENIQTQMMQEVIRITTSDDPLIENRKQLAAIVAEYARYQVLILEPTDESDWLHGLPGVSSSLKPILLDIVGKVKWLEEYVCHDHSPKNWDNVWNLVLFRYRVLWSWVNLHGRLRSAWGDVVKSESDDWLLPFIRSMCVWEEHNIRKDAGLPDLVGAMDALEYSVFYNLVASGTGEPGKEWYEAYPAKAKIICG